ncbi:MAG: DUF11 domain-containing protein [ANME-2 cluster archaeon]|nr:MAG: DUF11 domain-containing protein [ANME-2 cluster archaeon]
MKHKSILTIAVVFAVIYIAMAGTASAKSMYLIADHTSKAFDAYNINPDGTATYQARYTLQYASAPAGLAVDTDSNTLMVTTESGLAGFEMVNANDMTFLGTQSGSSNMGGIEVDEINNVIYAIKRGTNDLYVYDWNPSTRTATPRAGNPQQLANTVYGMGTAINDNAGLLYVADSRSNNVRAYSTSGYGLLNTYTVSGFNPTDVEVDTVRGYLYTSEPDGSCASGTGGSNTKLARINLANSQITYEDVGYGIMGIAVDEVTGYVYLTEGCNAGSLQVLNTNLQQIQRTASLGNPAGIVIPQSQISYNPLNLEKTDGLTQANPGATLTYQISYQNLNQYAVSNVVITDDIPAGTTFVSADNGGTHSAGVVTWNIGSLAQGATGTVTVTVTVDAGTSGMITNYATIDSAEIIATTVYDQTNIVPGTNGEIPEFPTIALPIAAIFGLMFLLQRRKD